VIISNTPGVNCRILTYLADLAERKRLQHRDEDDSGNAHPHLATYDNGDISQHGRPMGVSIGVINDRVTYVTKRKSCVERAESNCTPEVADKLQPRRYHKQHTRLIETAYLHVTESNQKRRNLERRLFEVIWAHIERIAPDISLRLRKEVRDATVWLGYGSVFPECKYTA
jgi:hypothetical protein